MTRAVRLLVLASCLIALLSPAIFDDEAHAQALPPQKVLFVGISGSSYNGDGVNFYNTVAAAAGAGNATYVLLSGAGGQVVNALANGTYDQIWVYDLSSGADNYPNDYQAIADWYANHPSKHIICDGRIISSYWSGRHTTEGAKLSQNYFHNLALRKGGLVLTTDHSVFQTGINSINSRIGIQPFVGDFSLTFIPVDTANVLMTTPNNMGTQLYDDSSPGQTPFGLQPNGKVLYTLAWHSGNTLTPGISTTIQGSLGVQGAIAGVTPGALLCGETTALNLTATATNGIPPYTFSWRVSPGGQLGTGANITVPIVPLGMGERTIHVLVTDSQSLVDDETVTFTVGTHLQCAGFECLASSECHQGEPYCASLSGEFTCVACDDTSAGGVDLGCNTAAPHCDPVTRACVACAPGEVAPACARVDELCLVPNIDAVSIDNTCRERVNVGQLDPVVGWTKSSFTDFSAYNQVMMTPVVMNLTDDNNDGLINKNDIADIAFTRFTGSGYGSAGILTVISGDDGRELFSTSGDGAWSVAGAGGVALGDLDGNGRPEMCVTMINNAVSCWEAAVPGSAGARFVHRWRSSECGNSIYSYPSMANVDGTGTAELIMPGPCVLKADGTLLAKASSSVGGTLPFAADMDDDTQLEIVAGAYVFELPSSGTTLVQKWAIPNASTGGFSAVADMDGDGRPELVMTDTSNARVVVFDPNAATDADSLDGWTTNLPTGSGARGGAPNIADFDGDGLPEVGVAGSTSYAVFDTNGSVLWQKAVQDDSSRSTGSAVFDFDGDGRAEVIYGDELDFWIYDGPTGNVRARFTDHASGTLQENPLVADVNNDGKAEIIIAANNYAFSGTTGVRIIRSQSNSWAPAPPVWNQHAYTISNIEDGIKIPLVPVKNWGKWNNFRAGAPQEGLAGAMPDLFVHDFEACVGGCVNNSPEVSLSLSIGNRGGLDVSSVTVELRRGSPTGTLVKSIIANGPIGGGKVNIPTSVTRAEWGTQALYARVASRDAKVECILENNATNLGFAPVVPDIDNDNIPDTCDACITRGAEACNGLDDDCDGATDEGCDDDNDDYCDATLACSVSPTCPRGCGDCNDGNAVINPGAADSVCNGVDNDCDGQTDEHYQMVQTQCGVGGCRRNGVTSCVAGEVRDSCSPAAPSAEVCDGADNDCDGLTDALDTSLVLPLCEKQQGVCAGASKSPTMCVNGAWQACSDAQYTGFAFPHYSTSDLCDNRDNDCDGIRDENHVVENTSCGTGACGRTGQRICSNGAIVNTCAAGAPASDANCNGLDDDCDGSTDEHYVGAQTSCGTGLCARTGQNYCVLGAVVNSCSPGAPAASDASCNAVDDDCDGSTDEHYVATQTSCGVGECARTGTATCNNGTIVNSCVVGPASAEVCDGKDNDCDGLVDGADANMALVACEKQQGVCSGLMKTASQCVGGVWQACSEPYYIVSRPGYSANDGCDGLDNDCDGSVDESFTPSTTTCGVGGCQRSGETSCVAGVLADSCVAAAPRTETCDGIDNDCDGSTDAADNSLSLVACEKQDGVCAGALKPATLCVAGGWLPCGDGVYASHRPGYSTVDACDGIDNDCDGGVDESFVSEATSCGVGECGRTGATSCVAGNVVDSCVAGQAQAEICDGKDNDCDGLVDAVDPSLVSVACEKQAGVCAGVSKPANLCVGGAWQSCSDAVYVAARFGQYGLVDACDGLNNDCDGQVDEDFAVSATSCGRGACERSGQRICSGGAVVDTCVAGNPAASDPTCNGVDDDCDGQTDESYAVRGTTCGQGACLRTGFAYCVQGQIFDSCVAAATAANDRTCDGNDDDCDGQVDEDFLAGQICVAGLGACQRTGTLSCGVNGTICTAEQGIATPEVCDGVDNDCDGNVDEGVVGSVCARKDTAILSGPSVVTASRSATLRYHDPLDPAATAFQCSLDGGPWVRCDGGVVVYHDLGAGPHTFLVRSVGADGAVDATPAFFAWSVDFGQPDTLIRVAPLSPSQSTTANFVFGATIEEVATYRCALDPAVVPPRAADYLDCQEVLTLNHLDEGPHELFVYVVGVSGVADPTPAHHAWVIDLSAPETLISSGPSAVTSANAATLEYASDEPGITSFRCRFNGGEWVVCDGGVFMVDGLDSGAYTFEVAAVDEGGIQDPTPATWSWVVDSDAPDTFIAIHPQDPAQEARATFAFASDETDVTYRCVLDVEEMPELGDPAWQACDAVTVWEGLASGSHTLWVAAVDVVGQWDPTPATYTWVVDVTAPDTTILSRPPVQTGPNDGAEFEYASNMAEVYFECRVDAGGWQRCDAEGLSLAANNLSIGDHSFQVRACTEASGLCDPTPAVASWTVTTSNCPLDASAPTIVCPVGGIHECVGEGMASVSLGGVNASDSCGVIETSEAVPTAFALGTTSVVLSVEDGNRNRASCVTEVTVVDTQAPSITCGDDMVVANDEGVCGAVVELAEPWAEDGCHAQVAVFNNAPSVFPVGETVVVWTALDPSGLMASCEVKVVVEDREAGRLVCAGELAVDAPADQCAWAGPIEAIARDNCSVDLTTLTEDKTYPVGQTDVLFTSVDPHGNTATCTTALTVRDVTAPVVTCPVQVNDMDMGPFVATATDACEATVELKTLRCETLGEGGVVTGNLGSAECPAKFVDGALVVDGRLGDVALKVSFVAEGVDPSGNIGTAECALVFDPDKDDDGVLNADDNCPAVGNADQRDVDGDGFGDTCDVCPSVEDPAQADSDGNGVGDACQDLDRDGLLDAADNCPGVNNADQLDSDGDGIGDLCDETPWEGMSAKGSGGCEAGGAPWSWLGGLLGLFVLVGVRRRAGLEAGARSDARDIAPGL